MKEFYDKVTADKIWASFKQVFTDEYNDLVEEIKVTNGDAGFHSANGIQEIRGALDHLAMAEVANKNIVTKLKEAVETPTRKKYVRHEKIEQRHENKP